MNHVDALSRAPIEDAREMDTASLKIAKTIIDEEDWLFSIQLCPNVCPTSAKSQFKAKFEANLGAKQQQ